ncbi:hypothetical protein BC938DRAFT_483346 [Jimgerdemannia flammicorona]|uniref:Uncharacterized protein n=1 Tax=Jimgerdemannia flammicorona TaxID=994334 RepID=A0A433QC63_9FUNG|nr:hypothetical protein BC938DRAFT_483346 [Jimgerdemannia flammicorona]
MVLATRKGVENALYEFKEKCVQHLPPIWIKKYLQTRIGKNSLGLYMVLSVRFSQIMKRQLRGREIGNVAECNSRFIRHYDGGIYFITANLVAVIDNIVMMWRLIQSGAGHNVY